MLPSQSSMNSPGQKASITSLFFWIEDIRPFPIGISKVSLMLGDDVVDILRKTFSVFSRKFQFAAVRPTRLGVRLGLAVSAKHVSECEIPNSSDNWSDRLKAARLFGKVAEVGEKTEELLLKSYEAS